MSRHYLDYLFSPRTIAVFGAGPAPDSVGGRVFNNLMEGGFGGPVYAINPKHQSLNQHPCYASLDEVNKPVDLAIVATPAQTVPEILHVWWRFCQLGP